MVHVPYAHPWVLVAGLAVIPMTVSMLESRHNVIMIHASVYIRTAVSTMLYNKSLSVSNTGRGSTSTGQVGHSQLVEYSHKNEAPHDSNPFLSLSTLTLLPPHRS